MKFINSLAGLLSFFLVAVSTIILFLPFFFITLLKLFPNKIWRILLTQKLHKITTSWINLNNLYFDYMQFSKICVEGIEKISDANWYLIIVNHQSGTDVIVLQYIFNKIRKLPFLTFLSKNSKNKKYSNNWYRFSKSLTPKAGGLSYVIGAFLREFRIL